MSSISVAPSNAAGAARDDAARPHGPLRESLTGAQALGLDDPAVLRQCQMGPAAADGSVPLGLGLSGMYCAACALTIEGTLRAVPGVRDVQVQGATQRARVVVDPANAPLSALVRAVQAVGYNAWPDVAGTAMNERLQAQRHLLWRLLVAWFCMMQIMMISTAQYVGGPAEIPPDLWRLLNWAAWVLSLPPMLFSCGPFFRGAFAALRQGRVAMDTPVALGIVAMFGVSTGVTFGHQAWLGQDVYFDSLSMFVAFLLTGRWLESRARERVTRSLEILGARLPEAVERSRDQRWPLAPGDGAVEAVPLSALAPGDLVRVAVGQAFPADGELVDGRTEVDEALLTGESRPVPREAGQPVVAGSLNLGAPVWCRVDRLGQDTRYQQIVGLVHQALTEKPGWMRAADRFAGPFLWAVLALAALGGLVWLWIAPDRALWVAVSVLVVTCPCALSLSAPSALLAAAGALARGGVLVRRLDAVESLARVRHMLLDKTGTVTDARLQVLSCWSPARGAWEPARGGGTGDGDADGGLALAASLAAHSRHPVSRAVAGLGATAVAHTADASTPNPASAATANTPGTRTAAIAATAAAAHPWLNVEEIAGQGLQAWGAGGQAWRLGSPAWALQPVGAGALAREWPQGRVWLVPQDPARAPLESLAFELDETPRAGAADALRALRALGVDVALLSGDQPERVQSLVSRLGLEPPLAVAGAGATPEDKLAVLPAMKDEEHPVAVVGDGINDAPVLARAGVSFALDEGAALAQSQADFIVLGGRLQGLPLAMRVSRQAMKVVRQNLLWSAAYNFVCIPLALAGLLPPWLAGVGMAASSLVVVLNALRVGAGAAHGEGRAEAAPVSALAPAASPRH